MSDCKMRKIYQDAIDEIRAVIANLNLPQSYDEDFLKLRSDIDEREILIPVIGHFSSGKSSMLNRLMNAHILPVGISPETTLATELRYSQSENLIAYDASNGMPQIHQMSEFSDIVSNPSKWLYVTLGLPFEALQNIEPLILVDMPGFNSPVEQHNKAINLYIGRGAFYFVLIPADAGTVDRTILLQMKLIIAMGRQFSVFITKSDLKTPADIEKIKTHISNVIKDEFDLECPIVAISEKDISAVSDALKSADANAIFKSIYQEILNEKINSLICNIRTELNSLQRDTLTLERAVEELKSSIETFKSKADDEIRRVRDSLTLKMMVDDIVNKTGTALSMAAEEIAQIVMSGDVKAAQQRINSIVQAEIQARLNQKFGSLSANLISDIANTLKSLDYTMKNFSIDEDFITNICDSVQKIINCFDSGADKKPTKGSINPTSIFALGTTVSTVTSLLARSSGTILGFSACAAIPVVNALAIALPLILTPIYKNYKKNELREQILENLRTIVFPGIKIKLRTELQIQIKTQIENMVTKISNEFQSALQKKEQAVSEAIKLKQSEKDSINSRIVALDEGAKALLLTLNELVGNK